MNEGWIKLHRKFIESPLWVYSINAHMPHLISLWVYILITANWEDKKWYDGKNEISIQKGSLITSLDNLALNLSLTRQQVRTALNHYEKMRMITRKTTSQWTQIWVVNWDRYQMKDNSNNKPITNEQQTNNKPITTTKEYKNIRNKEYIEREETHVSYLLNLPVGDVEAFVKKYSCTENQLRGKAEELYNYCKSKGKVYKDYRALLSNAVRKDFGLRSASVVNARDFIAQKEREFSEEEKQANLKRLEGMKISFMEKGGEL